ncbi:hypothetical protein E4U46_003708 [Claviceps purpurea]|nr:hypothetical protein E4U46_003708 [Claviceps purpurea]
MGQGGLSVGHRGPRMQLAPAGSLCLAADFVLILDGVDLAGGLVLKLLGNSRGALEAGSRGPSRAWAFWFLVSGFMRNIAWLCSKVDASRAFLSAAKVASPPTADSSPDCILEIQNTND